MDSIRNLELTTQADIIGQLLTPEQVAYLERYYASLCHEIVSRPIDKLEEDGLTRLAFTKGKASAIREMLTQNVIIREAIAAREAETQSNEHN